MAPQNDNRRGASAEPASWSWELVESKTPATQLLIVTNSFIFISGGLSDAQAERMTEAMSAGDAAIMGRLKKCTIGEGVAIPRHDVASIAWASNSDVLTITTSEGSHQLRFNSAAKIDEIGVELGNALGSRSHTVDTIGAAQRVPHIAFAALAGIMAAALVLFMHGSATDPTESTGIAKTINDAMLQLTPLVAQLIAGLLVVTGVVVATRFARTSVSKTTMRL